MAMCMLDIEKRGRGKKKAGNETIKLRQTVEPNKATDIYLFMFCFWYLANLNSLIDRNGLGLVYKRLRKIHNNNKEY